MTSIFKTLAVRRASAITSTSYAKATPVFVHRTYASEPSRGATSRGTPNATNIRDSPSSSGEASEVNSKRATDSATSETKPTAAQPVSNPEQSGLGAQEEPQPSQENTKRPKEEPDHIKRQHVEKEGQKPLDPADDGFGAVKRDSSK